ncbi:MULTISPECIES: IS110 family transposase [Chryseobacterium]|uniref:Transposase n=1 Tax=Chryseobacterium geocarposphaerae TaxID=1416776 RepID=A0ABU1LBK7_9FLAO|nr:MULTISPECIES: IS110 family transposase [Chryseobacterium]MDR6404079.1 transposase [Chryseobacterium geocarposphaerae]MDR6698402.1 transposase [Chryseobacterium ginsenosidimutans]
MEKIVIGIDISSKTLDICIKKSGHYSFEIIDNEVKSISNFLKKVGKSSSEIIISMENTGRYNWNLYEVLETLSFKIFVLNPLHLKKSLGLIRGKDDKIDAKRICDFTEKNEKELIQWKPCSETLKKIKLLFTERNSKVKLKASLLKQRILYSQLKGLKLDSKFMKMNKKEVELLEEHIDFLEKEIERLIETDEDLSLKKNNIRSIPGVGKVLSWMIIAKTEGFTKVTDPRKMACYAGVAPFGYQSGTSLRYRPKVSHYADKSLKTILHMAAMRAVRMENDLKEYYQRKIKEGKNKMAILNAVRNKIIHRIFAIVKNGKSYEKNYLNNLILS